MNDKSQNWFGLLFVSLLSFALLAGLLVHQSELNSIDVLEDVLLASAQRLGTRILPQLESAQVNDKEISNQLSAAALSLNCRVRLLGKHGQVISDSQLGAQTFNNLSLRPEIQAALSGDYMPYTGSDRSEEASPGLFVAVPLKKNGQAQTNWVLYYSSSIADLQSEMEPLRWVAAKGLLLLTFGTLVWAWWLTGRFHSLKRQLWTTYQQVHQRVPVALEESHDVRPLAESYNQLLDELRDKVVLLEVEKSRQKRFLQDLAHFLKTPLTGMAASIEAVQGIDLSDSARNLLMQRIGRETSRLSRLVHQILALEKIGYTSPKMETFELGSLIEVTLAHFEVAAQQKSLELRWDEGFYPVQGDSEQIRAVLQNLIDNAIRCSPPGTYVLIRCIQEGRLMRVEVCDQGPGVTDEEQRWIFERLASGRANAGSMGLGLAIAKSILKAHGQTIGVSNQADGGACFAFTLTRASS